MKIAIASGKGGTGKTTLATNLASVLAEIQETVLVDLDVEEPNSGIFIKADLIHKEDKFKMIPEWIEDKCSLCGICYKVCNFHAVMRLGKLIMILPELCHSCYACYGLCPESALTMTAKKVGELRHYKSGNLNFIESRLHVGEEQAVPLIRQTHQYVNQHFENDIIRIYDSPPGTPCPVIEATRDSDFVILATEPTPFGLHDLKLAVQTMKELQKSCGVVVNRYGTGNDDVSQLCKNEDIPVLAKIPNDRRIAEFCSKGQLIFHLIPALRNELDKIIEHILISVNHVSS